MMRTQQSLGAHGAPSKTSFLKQPVHMCAASRLLELLEQQLGFAVARVAGELAQVLAQIPAGLLLRLRLLMTATAKWRQQAEIQAGNTVPKVRHMNSARHPMSATASRFVSTDKQPTSPSSAAGAAAAAAAAAAASAARRLSVPLATGCATASGVSARESGADCGSGSRGSGDGSRSASAPSPSGGSSCRERTGSTF